MDEGGVIEVQHKNNLLAGVISEELYVHLKWWYVVRIIQWHHAELLLLPSLITYWVLNQLHVVILLFIIMQSVKDELLQSCSC